MTCAGGVGLSVCLSTSLSLSLSLSLYQECEEEIGWEDWGRG